MGSTTGHETAALEAGNRLKLGGGSGREKEKGVKHGRTAHNMSSSLRKKSDLSLVWKVRCGLVRDLLANLQEIFLSTKLSIFFSAIPLAVAANCFHFRREWLFALSLLGLTPLAERVSFLTEQIAFYTGPTGKIEVIKCSLDPSCPIFYLSSGPLFSLAAWSTYSWTNSSNESKLT